MGLILSSAVAAAPAWAETSVRERLRERFAGDEDFAVDIDLGGVELRGLSHELAGGKAQVFAGRVRIRPGSEALVIEIEDLQARWQRGASSTPSTTATEPGAARAQPSGAKQVDPLGARLARLVDRLHGVPVEIVTTGRVSVALPEGLELAAEDPRLSISADGRLEAEAEVALGSPDRRWLKGSFKVSGRADEAEPLTLAGDGPVVIDPEGARRRMQVQGLAGTDELQLELIADGGGASVSLHRGERREDAVVDRLRVDAHALPLPILDPMLELLAGASEPSKQPGTKPKIGEARLSGAIEVERTRGHASAWRARFDGVELRELVVDDRRLAPEPLHFDPLTIDGELSRTRDRGRSPRHAAQLLVDHGGVQAQLGVQLDDAGLELALELPETRCQDVLSALPRGSVPVLAGTELRGSFSAHLGLTLDFAELAAVRARYLDGDADPHAFDRDFEAGHFDAPGKLDLDLPVLERCTIARIGPAIDSEGLDGPYRHTFVTGSGRDKRRVFAPGDDGYVPLREIPKLALAFVILEDWRYWSHDGFDRHQLGKAFWYNLMVGRVARGASTISQQTARSLWLGVDRSVARKLAEALLTVELERTIDKRRLLEVYLNVIELGPEVHGVAEAARYHFGKRAQDLDLAEALHLASMAPAPVAYSRRFAAGEIDAPWREHLQLQIRRLRIRGMIDEGEAQAAARLRLKLVPHPELRSTGASER